MCLRDLQNLVVTGPPLDLLWTSSWSSWSTLSLPNVAVRCFRVSAAAVFECNEMRTLVNTAVMFCVQEFSLIYFTVACEENLKIL